MLGWKSRMDQDLVLVGALALFCVRDARLIASRRGLLSALFPLLLVAAGTCGVIAENLSLQRTNELLGDPRLWISAMVLHGALAFLAARKYRRAETPDWIAVVPTPITGIGLTLGSRAVLVYWNGAEGVLVGVALGGVYLVAVGLLAVAIWPRRDGVAALRYSSLTHLSALLLVPSSSVLDNPIATQSIQWERTALVLASIAAIVAISFFWHRSRRR